MKINKFYLTIAIVFVVGFILILLNFLTPYLNLAALILFFAGLIMLTIALFKFCLRRNAEVNASQEEIIMELSLVDGQEQYIPADKKQKGFKRFVELYRIFSPCVLSGIFTILVGVLLVLSIIKQF